jgi:chloramphenicol-sensitive protein RarD
MHSEQQKAGLLFALAAFIMWGLAPIYFKQLQHIAPQEILSQRIVWSVIFLILVVLASRQLHKVIAIKPLDN